MACVPQLFLLDLFTLFPRNTIDQIIINHKTFFCYFERLIKVEKFHWMPLKFQKLDRRDFSESECFSSPHSLKYNCFTLLWDGWRYQNGWVFGKSSKGGRGVIYNPKNYIEDLCTAIFRKKCKISFRKLGGNKGRLDFHPFWYQHPSLICKL